MTVKTGMMVVVAVIVAGAVVDRVLIVALKVPA